MSNFEKKFGKYAIHNLSLMLIMCYVVGYIINWISPEFLGMLELNPYEILHGQVWRIFTWIIVPPESLDIFTLLMLYVYYSIGTALENTWGAYRYNVYIFMGMIFTVLASFVALGVCYAFHGEAFANEVWAQAYFAMGSSMFSTYYINMTIMLAFALTYPNVQMLLMFVIPIKMKWLGIIDGVYLVMQFIMGTGMDASYYGVIANVMDIFMRCSIAASLLTVGVFWLMCRNRVHMTPQQRRRRQEFKREVKINPRPSGHKCAICGRTDQEEGLEFRYCSKCEGNYEYCQEHLFTHEHVVK
ncbi:MAG: hypothetical protein IJX63_04870 [Lachnospiraceae bacterium]|nr:hypothetical protein [Lachnospiraceae bacterium]